MNPRTLPGLLEARCKASSSCPAFHYLDHNKHWRSQTWAEFSQVASQISAGLSAEGVGRGDRVGILAPTSLAWEHAQMGALRAGALVVGLDPNYAPDQLEHTVRLLDPSVLFVADEDTLARLPADSASRIRLVIMLCTGGRKASGRTIQDLIDAGRQATNEAALDGPHPRDPAAMVFTSGTTGPPKAIVFSHEQVLTAVETILDTFDDIGPGTVLLCWLPLANLFQRVINFCAIGCGASSYILSDPRELMTYLGSIHPEILIGVPRIFERIHAGIAARIAASPRPGTQLAAWALRIAQHCASQRRAGVQPSFLPRLSERLADALVLRRLRAVFGTRLRYFVSGSAPMPLWLLEWFEALGMPVLEAYGISEDIVPLAMNQFSDRKLGTVGRPLAPNEIRLGTDGEVQVRGPALFQGYWNDPDSTANRFDSDGFWATGDLGELDQDGFLRLVGRKSEVFKGAAGRWVSPARVEEGLRRVAYVEQAVVVPLPSGSVGAVLSFDCAMLAKRLSEKAGIHRADRIEGRSDVGRLSESQETCVRADLGGVLDGLPGYQRPEGVLMTPQQFSVAGGQLTSNLKLRRGIVARQFAAELASLDAMITRNHSGAGKDGSWPVIGLA